MVFVSWVINSFKYEYNSTFKVWDPFPILAIFIFAENPGVAFTEASPYPVIAETTSGLDILEIFRLSKLLSIYIFR